MKVILAGAGAFGIKHLEAMAKINGIEVASIVSRDTQATAEVARHWRIPHYTTDLAEALEQPGVEAALLCTPTQMHARQAVQCLRAGKHVMIEIPIADSLADAELVVKTQKQTGLTAMGGHTRRFNPSHQWIHRRVHSGELKVLQMDVQT
ncbi:MAG TPA: Gfo/Idh/MocA family oxidoreductase, partial [Steroidobacteraceae bacterium]|nr:Gfo/Idh/MocA family oxidoreductase [Steroidobacteraceae bacterium]